MRRQASGVTLAEPLRHALASAAQRTAVICGDSRLDYAALVDRCRRLIGALREAGVAPGDRVAMLSANCHRLLEAYLAVPAGGMVASPLNLRLSSGELEAIVRDAAPKVLLCDRDPGPLAELVDRVVRFDVDYERWLAAASPAPLDDTAHEDDLAALFYTGGTTGHAKGVMLTHRNLIANSMHKAMACRIARDDVYLGATPMFHVAGTAALHGLCFHGACAVMQPSFEPARALDLIERHRVSIFLPVPTMLAALVAEQNARPRDVRSLRLLGHAGSPIASQLIRAAHECFPGAELAQYYGATETASIVTALPHEERELDGDRLGSCGLPVPGVSIRVRDASGAICGAGEVGQIEVRGPNVTVGYWNDDDATRDALVDGWYRTGDVGLIDPDGYLFLLDRAKDMIVSGGENVYSVEVEDVLLSHPQVLEAAVFGIPDARWGEAVHAVVLPAAGCDRTSFPDALRAYCKERIAGYKVPKSIELSDGPLPKSGPGKVLKRQLREPHWRGQQRQIG